VKQLLDDLDKKIIVELEKDATRPYKMLSEILKVPHSTIFERVKRLKNLGIIKAIIPLIDTEKCGLSTTAWIRVNIGDFHSIDSIEKEICKIKNVLEVHEISGEWDILLKVKVKNNRELRDLEIEKIGKIQGIKDLASMIAVKTIKDDPRIVI